MFDFKSFIKGIIPSTTAQNDRKDIINKAPKSLLFDCENTVFEPNNEVDTSDYGMHPLTVEETREYMEKIEQCVNELFVEGIHYGTMEGVTKKFIYRPGAELIILMLGVRQRTEIVSNIQDFEKNLFSYTAKTWLVSGSSGAIISEGYGICSSTEEQFTGRNPADLSNICIKLAKKRSLSDSVLGLGLSNSFSQDIELVPKTASEKPAKPMSDKQLTFIESLMQKHNMTAATLDNYVQQKYSINSYKEATSTIASEIISKFKSMDENKN